MLLQGILHLCLHPTFADEKTT